MNFIKSIPVTSDMVSLWVPSGTYRILDIIRGNYGKSGGTHPSINVPVIREDSAVASLVYDNSSGTFTVGEDITGGTSSAFGVIVSDSGSTLVLKNCTGLFNNNEEITGGSSGKTADVNHADNAVGVDGHVKNGAFISATTSWTAVTATLSSEGSGKVGNRLKVASSGANVGKAYQDVTTVIGKVYKFTGYFKKGDADTGRCFIGTTGDEDAIYDTGGLSDTSFTKYTHVFIATATTTRLTCKTDDATDGEYSLFDEVSLYEIARTQLIDTSLGWCFDIAGEFVRVDEHSSLKITDDITLGAWVFPVGWGEENEGRVFSKTKYFLYLDYDGAMNLSLDGVGSQPFASNDGIASLDTWSFLTVARKKSTGKVDFYINGSLDKQVSGGTESITTNTDNLLIGNRKAKNRTFDGCIALPFIVHGAWSAAHVSNFFLATKGLFSPRG